MSGIETLYKNTARPLLFLFDPEHVHEWIMAGLQWVRPIKPLFKNWFSIKDARLQQTVWNLVFENPIGLAGGFDKNAVCTEVWDGFGFSFVEVGTVTPRAQPGNPKPRLFRYPKLEALVNRMGFNNDGAEAVAQRLRRIQHPIHPRNIIVGISLGKQVDTPADDLPAVIQDYTRTLEILHPYGDFFVVNVSSPNTKNLRDWQQKNRLDQLLNALVKRLDELGKGNTRKPLCVKLSPDLSNDEIHDAVNVVKERNLDGIIATNTTNQTMGLESGGLSGKPLWARSTAVIRLISQQTQGKIPIIGCGGIFSVEDAVEKMQAGAWLLQVYTGFVYQGPTLVRTILEGLIQYMERNQLDQIQQIRPDRG